jgi:hypothetical protein
MITQKKIFKKMTPKGSFLFLHDIFVASLKKA